MACKCMELSKKSYMKVYDCLQNIGIEYPSRGRRHAIKSINYI